MRFICPELDKSNNLEQQLLTTKKQKSTMIFENGQQLFPAFRYSVPEAGPDSWAYGTQAVLAYLEYYPYVSTQRTIGTLATALGCTITTNTSTTALYEFRFHRPIGGLSTNLFYVVYGDDALYFLAPQRGEGSKQITKYKYVNGFFRESYFDSVSFTGETGYNVLLDVEVSSIIPALVDSTVKNMAVNKFLAQNGIITIHSAQDASPLDFIIHEGRVYVAMSKKTITPGMYEYICVRESAVTQTFSAADVTPVAITTTQTVEASLDYRRLSDLDIDDLDDLKTTGNYLAMATDTLANKPAPYVAPSYGVWVQVVAGADPYVTATQKCWGRVGTTDWPGIFERHYDANSGAWSTWSQIWDDATDGSGSGLDADKLDGLHADTAANGNTVVARNASADVSVRRLTATVATGSAPLVVSSTTVVSNFNADLLDGLHADMLTTAHLLRQGIINGGCRVAQRGSTALTTALQYGQVDRFQAQIDTGVSAGTLDQISNSTLGTSGYAVKLAGVTSSGQTLRLVYRMEARDARMYVNRAASFAAEVLHDVGGDVSFTVRFFTPTTTADDFSSLTEIESARASAQSVATGTATTVVRENVALGNCAKGLQVNIEIDTGGAYTAKNFEFAEFRLNAGGLLLPFAPRPYAEELALCQRYYQRRMGPIFGNGWVLSSTQARSIIDLPVVMRTSPTLNTSVLSGTITLRSGASSLTVTALGYSQLAPHVINLLATVASGLTINDATQLMGGAADYITLDAEL